jgi:hypothetical protein
MSKPDPIRGDRSDDPTGLRDLWQDRPAGHLDRDVVRTDSSYAKPIDSNAGGATGSSRAQSERGLDSVSASPEGDRRTRASGKSDGTRSDRSETSGGAELSAGWREVAEWCHAGEGTGHE